MADASNDTAKTVTVACKMPNGVLLRLFKAETVQEPVPGGGFRDVQVMRHTGDVVRINGYAAEAGKSPASPMTDEGYALTYGVSRDFWDQWLSQNRDLAMVENKLIFAHASSQSAKAESRDHAKTRNGLEPMAIKGDPRSPRSPRVGEIEKAEAA
jgi:hypothetical protein